MRRGRLASRVVVVLWPCGMSVQHYKSIRHTDDRSAGATAPCPKCGKAWLRTRGRRMPPELTPQEDYQWALACVRHLAQGLFDHPAVREGLYIAARISRGQSVSPDVIEAIKQPVVDLQLEYNSTRPDSDLHFAVLALESL